MIGLRAELVHLVTQFVAVDPNRAKSLQLFDDGAFAAAAASCQTNHVRERREVGFVLTQRRQEIKQNAAELKWEICMSKKKTG